MDKALLLQSHFRNQSATPSIQSFSQASCCNAEEYVPPDQRNSPIRECGNTFFSASIEEGTDQHVAYREHCSQKRDQDKWEKEGPKGVYSLFHAQFLFARDNLNSGVFAAFKAKDREEFGGTGLLVCGMCSHAFTLYHTAFQVKKFLGRTHAHIVSPDDCRRRRGHHDGNPALYHQTVAISRKTMPSRVRASMVSKMTRVACSAHS